MRIKLVIEYNGKNYSGWQRQKNAPSIQQVLEERLSILTQEKVTLVGSGRTDAGVHAFCQAAHFTLEKSFPVGKIAYAVNTMLPPDIRVKYAETVSEDFHAQYNAKKKTYRYQMYIGRISSPLKDELSAHIPYDEGLLNFTLMENAVKDLIGTHDFKGFQATGAEKKTTIREIYNADIKKSGADITLTITGNGFLYNMVRIIAGTLVWIGLGKIPPTAIKDVLETGKRIKAGKTFPANGLCLVSVEY